MRISKSGSVRGACLTLLCLFLVVRPLFAGPGPVNTRGGGDSPFLLIRLEQLTAGLRAGSFPVRWMPDAAYGLGYPFFNFYAALPYYVAAAFRLLGWGPILSLQVTQALGFLLAAAAMALLARHVFSGLAPVALATIAYTCAPFHLANVYVRGDSLSEFYAFVFYPLILWALLRLRDRPSWPGAAWLALSYGGLFLTHNLSALMFSPFVAAFALFMLWPSRSDGAVLGQSDRRTGSPEGRHAERAREHPTVSSRNGRANTLWRRLSWRTAGLVLAGGGLGLALSASLWLTAAVEMDQVWMGVKDIQTSGYFSYAGHLLGRNLVQPTLLHDYENAQSTPLAMGAVQAAMVAAGVVALVVSWMRGRKSTRGSPPAQWAFWLGGLVISTTMITPISRPLWDGLPLLPIVQFPWRFLSVQAFFGALLIGGLAQRLPKPWLVTVVGAAILIVAAVGNLGPEYLPIDEADVTPERLSLFETFTTNIGTTIRGEYLPAGVEPRPWASAATLHRDGRPAPRALSGEITQATLAERDARTERWQVAVSSEQAELAFATMYFPGWSAYLDGTSIDIKPLSNSGLISMRVPRGEHTIVLRFGRTAVRWIADLVSLAAAAVLIVVLWPLIRQLWRAAWRYASIASIIILLVVGTALLGRLLSAPATEVRNDDLSMDFDRMPFLHHNPGGIDFGGRARLDAYQVAETARGGETLNVTLQWAKGNADLVVDIRLVTPADAHRGFAPPPPPLTEVRAHIEGSTTLHSLVVPADVASGTYYLSLQVFDGQEEIQAVSARGETLGKTYLRPLWVDNPRPVRAEDPILARFGDRILLGDDVQVGSDGVNWEVTLPWQATTWIPSNYSCSLRVFGADGKLLGGSAQRDFEGGPGHGFWPTSAWPVGEWMTDRLRVPMPAGIKAEDAAALEVVLYDRSQSGTQAVGSAVVPLTERERVYEPPPMAHHVGATIGNQIVLLGYDLAQDDSSLRLTLHWQALEQMVEDTVVFVHLFDPNTEEIVAQFDARPLNGTYPTNAWYAREVVSDDIVLSLEGVPAGNYRLAVGMSLHEQRNHRLPVVTKEGKTVPDQRLLLEDIPINER